MESRQRPGRRRSERQGWQISDGCECKWPCYRRDAYLEEVTARRQACRCVGTYDSSTAPSVPTMHNELWDPRVGENSGQSRDFNSLARLLAGQVAESEDL